MALPKLFVTDLDSTALGGEHRPYARFPDVFSVFLDRLDSKGCRWAVNTAWEVNAQWELVLGSKVKSRPLFLMGEMGRSLAAIENGEPVFVEPFTSHTDREVTIIGEKYLYPLVKDISGRFSPAKIHFYGHLLDFRAVEKESGKFFEYVSQKYSSDENLICRITEKTITAYPAFLQKSRNLKEALRISGFSPEDVVIAGDNTADTAMMAAGLSEHAICPENAGEDVKEHVLSMGGAVGRKEYAEGVIDAFNQLTEKKGWGLNG